MVIPSRPRSYTFPGLIAFGMVVAFCFWRLELSAADLNDATANASDFLKRFFPPDLRATHYYSGFLWESIAMAIWGTALSFVFAALSTLTGARNFAPNGALYAVTRSVMSASRVIPDLILAIIFVFAFGPGPIAGVLTITIGCFGQMSKLWNEALERVDPALIEAVNASGVRGFSLLKFCGWPSVSREVWGFLLYTFDRAIREAVVIGIVGAGGIGMELSLDMRLFEYPRAATVVLMIVTILLLSEFASTFVRERLK